MSKLCLMHQTMLNCVTTRRSVSFLCRASTQRYFSPVFLDPRHAAPVYTPRNECFRVAKNFFVPRSWARLHQKCFSTPIKVVCSHCGGDDDDLEVFSDTLLDFGASSVSLSDVDYSKHEEMPGYISGSVGAINSAIELTPTWKETRITAYFEASQDADVAFAAVQERLNLPEVPSFVASAVEEVLESNQWTKRTQESWTEPFVVGRVVLRFPWHDAASCLRARTAAAAAGAAIPASNATAEAMEFGDKHRPVVELTLEGGEAFGMGEHPTTVLCLEWLQGATVKNLKSDSSTIHRRHPQHEHTSPEKERPNLEEVTILDYGCGSGVLGLAALKLNLVDSAACVDVDPISLASTHRNAVTNGLQDALSTWLPPVGLSGSATASALDASPTVAYASGPNTHEFFHSSSPSLEFKPLGVGENYPSGFRICVANIVQGPLIALAPTLAKLVQPGGVIALSGVLAEGTQGDAVCVAYRDYFPDIKVAAERDGWLLITGTRS